jgi:hypothetical protein
MENDGYFCYTAGAFQNPNQEPVFLQEEKDTQGILAS